MPPFIKIQKLYNIALDWVCHWLIKCLNNVKTNHETLNFRKYLAVHLSTGLKQELLSKALNIHMYKLPVSSKCAMLETFGNNQTKKVDFSQSGDLFVDELFSIYRVLSFLPSSSLLKLGICSEIRNNDRKYIAEINSSLYRSVKQMCNLCWVTLTCVGDTEILEILGSTCPHLKYIDVKNSHLVTDESLSYLLVKNHECFQNMALYTIPGHYWEKNSCCSQLVYLGISGTAVSSSGLLLSIIVAPKLYSFGGYIHEASLGEVTSYLRKSNKAITLNLTHIWECNITSKNRTLLSSICPDMKFVTTVGRSVLSVHCFEKLTAFTLDCDFANFESEVFEMLQILGHQLSSLSLKDSVNTLLDLQYLIDCASNLTELEAHLKWTNDQSSHGSNFSKLTTALICVNSSLCLENFLVRAPVIYNLRINFKCEPYAETSDSICDSLLIDTLGKESLQHLKHLHIESCGFGDDGLEQLLANCPNLCCVQGLLYWSNLSKSYLDELKSRITNNNWDVRLLMHGNECTELNTY